MGRTVPEDEPDVAFVSTPHWYRVDKLFREANTVKEKTLSEDELKTDAGEKLIRAALISCGSIHALLIRVHPIFICCNP
jgi:hypothetical protein